MARKPNVWLKYEVEDYQLRKHQLPAPPEHVDLVFCYRPVEELPEYIATARKLAATVFWYHSGLASASTEYLRGCWLSDEVRARVENALERRRLILENRYLQQSYQQRLEARVKLLEDESRGGIDITKFYSKTDRPLPNVPPPDDVVR